VPSFSSGTDARVWTYGAAIVAIGLGNLLRRHSRNDRRFIDLERRAKLIP